VNPTPQREFIVTLRVEEGAAEEEVWVEIELDLVLLVLDLVFDEVRTEEESAVPAQEPNPELQPVPQ
jgi:hypothetical protein